MMKMNTAAIDNNAPNNLLSIEVHLSTKSEDTIKDLLEKVSIDLDDLLRNVIDNAFANLAKFNVVLQEQQVNSSDKNEAFVICLSKDSIDQMNTLKVSRDRIIDVAIMFYNPESDKLDYTEAREI